MSLAPLCPALGRYQPSIRAGEWWRLFSSICLHGSFSHLLSNMLVFVVLAVPLEHRCAAAQRQADSCIWYFDQSLPVASCCLSRLQWPAAAWANAQHKNWDLLHCKVVYQDILLSLCCVSGLLCAAMGSSGSLPSSWLQVRTLQCATMLQARHPSTARRLLFNAAVAVRCCLLGVLRPACSPVLHYVTCADMSCAHCVAACRLWWHLHEHGV